MNQKIKNQKGFTLIELMVASTIFIIVMVIAIGAVLSIVDANRQAQSMNDVITNLNFSIESMVRDLREGSHYSGGGDIVNFTDANGIPGIVYSYATDSACLPPSTQCITKTDANGNTNSITSANVIIDSVDFDIHNSDSQKQPYIEITIKGHAGINLKTQSNFFLQTLVTQRQLGNS